MRVLAIGIAIAVIVFVLTAGHVIFLPLLFLPLGLFSLGHRRRRTGLLAPRRRSRLVLSMRCDVPVPQPAAH
jgi:hypothetical protein